jgi:FkbM family methyltransferase
MFIEKAKAAIKSMPIAYTILRPVVTLIRWPQHSLFRHAMKRFRQYCSELQEFVPEPIFVKVGANDGITGDPCSDLLLAINKWKGLLIEPVPYCVDRLKANFHDSRRFSIEQVAIGSTVGEKSFYYVDQAARETIPNLPSWFDQLGSFNKSNIIKYLNGVLAPFIIECTVEVSTLSDVLDKNGIRNFHLLHIDAEGYDYEVLKTLDLLNHAPPVIFVEHKELPGAQKKMMLRHLHKHGYSVRDCGEDYFAINKEANKQLRRTALRSKTCG